MIPASFIIETGYTQGNKLVKTNGNFYKGFYHLDKLNRYWTGEIHTRLSERLFNVVKDDVIFSPDYLTKNNNKTYRYTKLYRESLNTITIKNDFINPTDRDYDSGFMTRYFIQLRATTSPENNIYEVNGNNFNNYINAPNFNNNYKSVSFPWKLSGARFDYYEDNIRVYAGVEDTNRRFIQLNEKSITNLSKYLTDLTQFARLSFISGLIT
jgi:hypothetical protein